MTPAPLPRTPAARALVALGLGWAALGTACGGGSGGGGTGAESPGGASGASSGSSGAAAGGSSSGGASGTATGGTATGGSAGLGPEPPNECTPLSLADCEAEASCRVISAWPLDLDNACIEERRPIACQDTTCGDGAITYAVDPDGDHWQFSDGCVPAGWSKLAAPTDEDRAAASGGPC